MGLSIVVPVYNSEKILPLLVDRVSRVLLPEGGAVEMILVNDGSRDRSWTVIRGLVREYAWIRGVNLMRNAGQHNALLCGIRAARFNVVVTIDDDLQNPPEEIPSLLQKLKEGFDVVYGTPQSGGHGFLRNTASKLTKITLRHAMGSETARNVSAFRAFRTNLRDAFAHYQGAFVSIDVLLTWGTTNFASVRVRNDPRTIGTSNYTVRKLIVHAMNMMTGFSTLPLEVASIMGFVFVLFGFGVLAWVLVRWIFLGSVVPGFAFLASTISIFSGAQLFAIGVMGEYLARMHTRLMDRPSYVIREVAGTDAAAGDLEQLAAATEEYAGRSV
jgi:glycosyltransferase involved in cell wall biosynthesis